jgi:fatty-acyl-CoA synthase
MRFSRATHMAGGTLVFMDKFDAQASLRLIERYRVTHSQWVPTMFVRMLRLDEATRTRHDLSSHRVAVHAAAPCPVHVKRQMIDWWGPIVQEYYGSTDGGGITAISCEEWLAHPGSIGRADPEVIRICVEDSGEEAAVGQDGLVYLVCKHSPPEYLNDPDKTRRARHPVHDHWITAGDIGHVGPDGYVYLTDRKAFTIISGGVNIYPQQVEDVLCAHPLVVDAAVFGVPHAEMGEEVKAVVELAAGVPVTDETAQRLIDHCRGHLARYMVPRSVDFVPLLPRTPTGKLMKRELRSPYWTGQPRLAG